MYFIKLAFATQYNIYANVKMHKNANSPFETSYCCGVLQKQKPKSQSGAQQIKMYVNVSLNSAWPRIIIK